MNRWWRNTVKDYFTFSKKERIGIFCLIGVTVAFVIFSRYAPVTKPKPVSKDAFQHELAQLQITIDSSKKEYGYKSYRDDDNFEYTQPKRSYEEENIKAGLFAFDPNTLDADGWKRLGVRDRTVQTIQKFMAKGFKFRQPGDIRKIYGLKPEQAERLMPYVKIAAAGNVSNATYATASTTFTSSNSPAATAVRAKIIDINTADTAEFISLPGIGSKLAARIVAFRDKLGGFTSVNQVGETYGVPDSTFQLIKPRLQVNSAAIKTININSADVNILKAHPYIRWNIANAIINYKQQHGEYKSLQDLRKIDIITEEVYKKISPYLTL